MTTDSSSSNKFIVSSNIAQLTTDTTDYITTVISNPLVFFIGVLLIIAMFVSIFMNLGNDSSSSFSDNTQSSNGGYTTVIIIIIIVLGIINGFQYLYGINIVTQITDIFTNHPEIDITVNAPPSSSPPVPEIKIAPQVFNIPDNTFSYPDAKAVCAAYGSRLASYDEVENAYNKGGEWCNYGWSDKQLALFPTQKKTYDELQEKPGHEQDCGRPGVNGGFIDNPAAKFGVNCYGYKPQMTADEEELMENQPLYPKSKKDLAMEQRVDYWKEKLPEVLVSPFNGNRWSKI